MFSRRTRSDLAEQIRLQTEIASANKFLEERVQECTEELRQLLQSAGEGMYGVDVAGRLTFINPVALNLLGFTEEEMIGKEVHDLIHHSREDGSHYQKEDCPMYATCTNGSQNRATDEAFWRKDGRSFSVKVSSPLRQHWHAISLDKQKQPPYTGHVRYMLTNFHPNRKSSILCQPSF